MTGNFLAFSLAAFMGKLKGGISTTLEKNIFNLLGESHPL